MNFPDTVLPQSLLWPANILALALLGECLWHAQWRTLAKSGMQHLWLASCVGLMLLWSIKAGVKPGLNFHLLGATILTLMFGPRLAIIALAAVLTGVTMAGFGGWMSLGMNLLLMAMLPVLFSYTIYCQAHFKLPRHVFVYVFLDAFLAAWFAVILTAIAAAMVLSAAGTYPMAYLRHNYLIYFILIGWSEALLSGMGTMLMVAYKPEWLSTFSDKLYLKNHTL